jgi:hypothetical protein
MLTPKVAYVRQNIAASIQRWIRAFAPALLAFMPAACLHEVSDRLGPGAVGRVSRTVVRSELARQSISMGSDDWLLVILVGPPVLIAAPMPLGIRWLTVAPLRRETADIDFRVQYWDAIEPVIQSVGWLRAGRIERRDESPEDPWTGWKSNIPSSLAQSDIAPADVKDHALLQIAVEQYLSPDATTLTVGSALVFYEAGRPQYPAAAVYVAFESEPVGDREDNGGRAVALWASAHAERYRRALAEAMDEIKKMTTLALAGMAGDDPCAKRACRHLRDAVIVEESGGRLILRTPGAISSVPRTSAKGYGPLPVTVCDEAADYRRRAEKAEGRARELLKDIAATKAARCESAETLQGAAVHPTTANPPSGASSAAPAVTPADEDHIAPNAPGSDGATNSAPR